MQVTSTVTVPAPVVVHEIPLWQVIAAGGALLLALLLLVTFIVIALAGFRRNKADVEG